MMTVAQVEVLDRMDAQVLGQHLRTARRAQGLTQGDLAMPAQVTTAYVSRIESGERRPSLTVLRSFADTLGASLQEIIDDTITPVNLSTMKRHLSYIESLPNGSAEKTQLESAIFVFVADYAARRAERV